MLSDDDLPTSEPTALTGSTSIKQLCQQIPYSCRLPHGFQNATWCMTKILSALVFRTIAASWCRFCSGTDDNKLRWIGFQLNPLFRLEKTIAYEGKVVPSVYVDGLESSFFLWLQHSALQWPGPLLIEQSGLHKMVGVVKLHVEKMEQQKVIAVGSFVCVRACVPDWPAS